MRLLLRTFVLLLLPMAVMGQSSFELPCASGASPLLSPTYNSATGNLRAWVCVDATGHVSSPVFMSGTGTIAPNAGSAGAIANYPAAAGSTNISPDSRLTDDGANLTYTGVTGLTISGANASINMTGNGAMSINDTCGADPAGTALTGKLWCSTSSGNRWVMNNNNGGKVNAVQSGVDINTSDQVTGLHCGVGVNNCVIAPTSGTQPTIGTAIGNQLTIKNTSDNTIRDTFILGVYQSGTGATALTGGVDLTGAGGSYLGVDCTDGLACGTPQLGLQVVVPQTTGSITLQVGGVAPEITIGNNTLSFGVTPSSGVAGSKVGYNDLSIGKTTAAMTIQTSATVTNVTGMTWNIAANKAYRLLCEVPVLFAASATIQFALGGPGTATSYSLNADGPIGAAAAYQQINALAQTVYGTKTTASGAPAGTEVVHVNAQIRNGATASGTALTLQTAANGTNGITVQADAVCSLTQEN